MAEGFLKQYPNFEVFSAGTNPAGIVQPQTIEVMAEIGIDVSAQKPETVQKYVNEEFDYVITVCTGAKESCPVFTGKVAHRLHIGFDDPHGKSMKVFRRVRDEIKEKIAEFSKKAG